MKSSRGGGLLLSSAGVGAAVAGSDGACAGVADALALVAARAGSRRRGAGADSTTTGTTVTLVATSDVEVEVEVEVDVEVDLDVPVAVDNAGALAAVIVVAALGTARGASLVATYASAPPIPSIETAAAAHTHCGTLPPFRGTTTVEMSFCGVRRKAAGGVEPGAAAGAPTTFTSPALPALPAPSLAGASLLLFFA